MYKDFQAGRKAKSNLEMRLKQPLFTEREIWWCSVGLNIGSEEDGKHEAFERPVLIIKKFNRNLFWGLPMSSKEKNGSFHYQFVLHGRKQTVLLSQLRTWSSKRLIRRIGKVDSHDFIKIVRAWNALIKETDPLRGPRVPNGNCIDILTK